MAKLQKKSDKQTKIIPGDKINAELYNQLKEIYKEELQKNEYLFKGFKEPSEKLKAEKNLLNSQLINHFEYDNEKQFTITANYGNIIHKFTDVIQVKADFDKLIDAKKRFYYFKKE